MISFFFILNFSFKLPRKNIQLFLRYANIFLFLSHNFGNSKECDYMETTIRILDKDNGDKVSFIAYIIPAFAEAYKMNVQDAYRYLKKYGGLDFLHEHWWALHTDNVLYALDDIYTICNQNGGLR